MNAAQQALARASDYLMKDGPQSELVTVGGVKVWANVNRAGKSASKMPPGTTMPTGAVIQLPFPTIATAPETGSTILDVYGKNHRIESVTFLGHCWECVCGIS